jgi:hypothetical protein
MQRGRIGGETGIDERIEQLVVDHDRRARPPGDVGMIGRDDRDRLTGIAHDVAREHGLIAVFEAVAVGGHVVGREHRVHTGDREGGRDVDGADARGRVRRPERLTPEHPVGPEVARERELAPYLGDPVGADGALADAAVRTRADVEAHRAAVRRAATATSTASRMRP